MIRKKFSTLATLLFCASFFFLVQTITSFTLSPIGVHQQSRYKTELSNWPRRDVLGGVLGGAMFFGGAPKGARAALKTGPVADLPMVRLKLPQAGLGREYVAIKLKIDGKGPFNFMVDSGLTTELITPHLQQSLGIAAGNKKQAGLAAGGGTVANSLIVLDTASLCCGKIQGGGEEFKLPKLHAVITDFPQEHIDPAHNVEGMLGMELLSLFDVDFDFKNNRLRFWKPGTADTTGLVEIPAVVINESGLIGIRLSVPGANQPILAFLDCGSTFSCMNWKAAAQLGLPPKNDPSYAKGLTVYAVGVDGRLLELPIVEHQKLTFTGDIEKDSSGKPIGFVPPPKNWKDWDPVNLAVGDLPAFSSILGDGVTPYDGPAALVGLDIIGQRRVILEAGRDKTRRRRVFVSPQ